MTIGGLFAGIGGFELAAQWLGIEPLWSNEMNPFCCQVLRKNFNHLIIQDDIKNIGKHNLPKVDIITGGFPCQPFSVAGQRKGEDDNRFLWPQMLRVIQELRPSYVVGENVAGLATLDGGNTFDQIQASLEAEGYAVESFVLPACSVGATHRRDRIWILAYPNGIRWKPTQNELKGFADRKQHEEKRVEGLDVLYQYHGSRNIEFPKDAEPLLCRTNDGVSEELDGDRITALGNAIVPQVAYVLLYFIKQIHQLTQNQHDTRI